MRMYAHDYVWGAQDRRAEPAPPGAFLVALAAALIARLRARPDGA